MILPAIGSVLSSLVAMNRFPEMRVLGTRSVSTTRTRDVHLIAPKYAAAASTSSSIIALARSIIVLVFGFLGSALYRRPLRKSWIWRTKYGRGSAPGAAFS